MRHRDEVPSILVALRDAPQISILVALRDALQLSILVTVPIHTIYPKIRNRLFFIYLYYLKGHYHFYILSILKYGDPC